MIGPPIPLCKCLQVAVGRSTRISAFTPMGVRVLGRRVERVCFTGSCIDQMRLMFRQTAPHGTTEGSWKKRSAPKRSGLVINVLESGETVIDLCWRSWTRECGARISGSVRKVRARACGSDPQGNQVVMGPRLIPLEAGRRATGRKRRRCLGTDMCAGVGLDSWCYWLQKKVGFGSKPGRVETPAS